jgi:2,4-dienoyl-CoA reductase-like NADH-dependent reductase (Old Yellow Enzyme family)/NADPH-dependent 2,4-dienoyl-CoA reductase/sulfur reductase-like enzyme
LAPGAIGSLTLPNRVVMPAMDMNLCDDGSLTAAEIDHYAARARGGVGLVITGTGAVSWPHGAASLHQPGFSDDRYLRGMVALADAVHAEGGRVAMQLCHHGKVATVDMAAGRELLVPSVPVPPMDLSTLGDCTPEELMALATASGGRLPTYRAATDEDLEGVVAAFAAAAGRVASAGIDAVEIHAAHGYLLSTFLSPGYNQRTDAWGGSVAGRARLTCEVIAAVREVVGPHYPVLVRINGYEFGPEGGMTAGEAGEVAVLLAAAGADAIHVSANAHDPFVNFTAGPLPDTVAAYRHVAATVTAALRSAGHPTPVIAVGRLLPDVAEDMLAASECDFVSMGRQLLADPDLVNHLRSGGTAAVRPCINCYVCVEKNFFDATPCCAVNARLGRGERHDIEAAAVRRRVVVVGGGPAGMEAARVAALRGHEVSLYESSGHLGGTARLSTLTTPDNEPFVHWLVGQLDTVGVTVHLGQRLTAEEVAALSADVVVVATGAKRTNAGVVADPAVIGAPRVLTGDDLRRLITGEGDARDAAVGRGTRVVVGGARRLGLLGSPARLRRWSHGWLPLGRRVVVVGGGLVGLELAAFLAERGRQVTVVESGRQLGLPMALPRRWRSVGHARRSGVTVLRDTVVRAVVTGGVAVRTGDDDTVVVGCDDVVVAAGVEPDETFADAVRALGVEVVVIGDAQSVGYIEGAVRTGFDTAVAL